MNDRPWWIVRWPWGRGYTCGQLRTTDERIVVIRNSWGVLVKHPSSSTALQIATDIRKRWIQ